MRSLKYQETRPLSYQGEMLSGAAMDSAFCDMISRHFLRGGGTSGVGGGGVQFGTVVGD